MSVFSKLHPVLRAGWELGDRVRAELIATINPLTPAQWTWRPDPAAWCIGEIVEHLRLAEIGTSKMVRKLIRGDYRDWVAPPGMTLGTAELDRYPYGDLQAPTGLAPERAPDRDRLLPDLEAAHARFRLELAAFAGDDPEALHSPDPATGAWFTLGGCGRGDVAEGTLRLLCPLSRSGRSGRDGLQGGAGHADHAVAGDEAGQFCLGQAVLGTLLLCPP